MLHHPCKCCLWFKRFALLLNVISREPRISSVILKCIEKLWTIYHIAVSKSSKNHCLTVLLQTSITTPRKDDSMLSSAPSHSSLSSSPHSQSHPQLCQWTWISLCYLHKALYHPLLRAIHSSVSGCLSSLSYLQETLQCVWMLEPFQLGYHGFLMSSPERSSPVVLLFQSFFSLPRNQLLLRDPSSKFRNTQFLNECA